MEGTAFCPAHITGFFKAQMAGDMMERGSLGAGFSICEGVTSRVMVRPGRGDHTIRTSGYETGDTRVSEYVLDEFAEISGGFSASIEHTISIPVGYGLGCSGAVALSLSMALNEALGTGLSKEEAGQVAHRAEVYCRTGLGDVLAAYHGGFEIRTRAGAPGTGIIQKKRSNLRVLVVCYSPISTKKFMDEKLEMINGLGGKMVSRLAVSQKYEDFEDMSVEFARYVQVMTPKMESLVSDLRNNGIRCGVALFGQTVFALVSEDMSDMASHIIERHPGGITIHSKIDNDGARMVQ